MSELEPVVSFQNVSKKFRFSKETPQSILEILISAFSRKSQREKDEGDLWAVNDVSFDIYAGQAFGIVGRNGSGKSTILKLITRILRPTNGRIIVNGRMSALLELGAGFHQDLTGRENVFLNAALLGLTEEEIKAKFADILAFSELEDFIDMPVKHYSSGMYMRLGFSIAIHVEPNILIIDEILAVGDRPFQAKCIDTIMDMKRKGVTIIFVSHDINLMKMLCTHILWVDKGNMQANGIADDVALRYIEYSNMREGQQLLSANFERWGTGEVEITNVRLLNAEGKDTNIFLTGDFMTIEMEYISHQPIPNPEFGFGITREDGVHINGPNSRLAGIDTGIVQGKGIVDYHIKRLPFISGTFLISAAIHDTRFPNCYDFHKDAYRFRIASGGTVEQDGLLELEATWTWQEIPSKSQPTKTTSHTKVIDQ